MVVVLRLFIICSHRQAKSSLSTSHFSRFVSQTPAGRSDCFCFQTEKAKKGSGGEGVDWGASKIEDSRSIKKKQQWKRVMKERSVHARTLLRSSIVVSQSCVCSR